MAIIFMTVDLTSFSLMAQKAAFMKLGRFIETGTAHDILEKPQRKDTLLYVSLSQENEARAHGKNLRNAFHTGQSVFHL
jgi:ABC-type dipeptide/oligopeptide/nickel transport system ATPase component